MKRTVVLVAAFLLAAGSCTAAPVMTDSGTKALIFSFTGLSDMRLGKFEGGIGMRYYLADQLALRPDFNFSSTSHKVKNLDQPGFSDTKHSGWSLGFDLALEKHLSGPVSSISPFLGAGAGYDATHMQDEPSLPPNPVAGTALKTTANGHTFSVFALAGFEWGFTEGMTLGGEYRFGLSSSKSTLKLDRQDEPTENIGETTGTDFGFSTASLFLSIGW